MTQSLDLTDIMLTLSKHFMRRFAQYLAESLVTRHLRHFLFNDKLFIDLFYIYKMLDIKRSPNIGQIYIFDYISNISNFKCPIIIL